MQPSHQRIRNSELLIDLYQGWPSFHDAEVVSVNLERDAGQPLTGPTLTLKIHVFRLQVAQDDPARDNRLLTLVFREVENLQMSGFNHQNALDQLTISTQHSDHLGTEVFLVRLIPGFGVSCSFHCQQIEVAAVEPFSPKWGAWAQPQ